jgi:hypothetical protein
MIKKLAAAAIIATMTTTIQAQEMHTCKDPNGKRIIQNWPCGSAMPMPPAPEKPVDQKKPETTAQVAICSLAKGIMLKPEEMWKDCMPEAPAKNPPRPDSRLIER